MHGLLMWVVCYKLAALHEAVMVLHQPYTCEVPLKISGEHSQHKELPAFLLYTICASIQPYISHTQKFFEQSATITKVVLGHCGVCGPKQGNGLK